MRLVRKQVVEYYECICTGSLLSLEENKPLAAMLAKIQLGGINAFMADEKLKKFATGLLSSFDKDGYTNSRKLTPKGTEIVKAKKAWKELKGQFKFGIVTTGKNTYIVDFVPNYGDNTTGYSLIRNANISLIGEYENNYGIHIKDIRVDPNCFMGNKQSIEIECVYDYDADRNSYVVVVNGKFIEFPENPHTFKLVDNYGAVTWLQQVLYNYGDVKVSGIEIMLNSYSDSNKLLANAIDSIFEKKYFNAVAPDNTYRIDGIRLNIHNGVVAKQLLLKYLMTKAQKKYCGYSEITTLISEFYGLFKTCVDVPGNTNSIYSELLEISENQNKTVYLRLLAYKDLIPDVISCQYKVGSIKDFSNQIMSIEDLVVNMLGKRNVESVCMLTKYAYKNAAISRAINLFADALKRQYNVPLRMITAKDTSYIQADIARDFFDMLSNNENIIFDERNKKEIEKIHDRYYCIKRNDGQKEWIKMTGELDAIRFDNDFIDGRTAGEGINSNTKGRVKEMTVMYIKDDGIIPAILDVMEGK